MAKEATKTSPFGVRFDSDLLEGLKLAGIARSPQHALNLYEKSYLELIELKVKMNNEPEKKEEILKEREQDVKHDVEKPPTPTDSENKEPKKLSIREQIELKKINLNTKK